MYISELALDLATPEHRADPHAVYARLRAEHPVAHARHPLFGECRVLTRHADVQHVLHDPRLLNNPRNLVAGEGDPGEQRRKRPWFLPRLFTLFEDSIVYRDPPEHGRQRGLVAQAFTPRRVAQLAPRIEAVCHELIDAALRAGEVDLIEAFALPLPLRIMAELMGVPPAQRDRFRALLTDVSSILSGGLLGFLRQLPASRRFVKLLEELIELRRREPADDLLSALAEAHADGRGLDDAELLSMVFLLLFAGHETTVNLIGNGVMAFCEDPEQWQRVCADASRIPSAVEEILRYDGPTEHTAPRHVAEPLEVAGVELQRGDVLVPVLLAANRDGEVFAEPDRFDVGRDSKQHIAFGYGPHYCVGAALARLEGNIAFSVLRERVAELRLRAPKSTLRWRGGTGIHGVLQLPVELVPAG